MKKFQRAERRTQLYLENLGWTTVYFGARVCGVQVDLLCRDPQGMLTVVEVKAHSPLARVGPAQMRRLLRVCALISQSEPVNLILALVGPANITLLPVDALTAL